MKLARFKSLTIATSLMLAALVHAQTPPARETMMHHASGPFDVKLTPQADDKTTRLGRMTLTKQLHGDLEGTSQGEMLTAMGQVENSGVYVAVERVTGTLQGRRGSFALAHIGTMTRGAQNLVVNIVPDSGAGELTGIAGSMKIRIEAGGKHFYELDYTLPE